MISEIKIGESIIGSGFPVFVIAEIGINHEGDVSKCNSMIKAASDAGADAVKLQTVDAGGAFKQKRAFKRLRGAFKIS